MVKGISSTLEVLRIYVAYLLTQGMFGCQGLHTTVLKSKATVGKVIIKGLRRWDA